MDLPAYFTSLYDYNDWANRLYLDAALALPGDEVIRPLGHSWGSIQGVLLHMMSAEWMWLRRWSGESPRSFPSTADFPTLSAIAEHWTAQEAEVRAFIASHTTESIQREFTYTNTRGRTFHLPLWQALAHVSNHNTHHRGELAAMFASLNAPHPEEEMNQYFLEQSGQK